MDQEDPTSSSITIRQAGPLRLDLGSPPIILGLNGTTYASYSTEDIRVLMKDRQEGE